MIASSAPFVVGDLKRSLRESVAQAVHVDTGDELETTLPGEVFTKWGWIGEWGDGCVRPSQFEKVKKPSHLAAKLVV